MREFGDYLQVKNVNMNDHYTLEGSINLTCI